MEDFKEELLILEAEGVSEDLNEVADDAISESAYEDPELFSEGEDGSSKPEKDAQKADGEMKAVEKKSKDSEDLTMEREDATPISEDVELFGEDADLLEEGAEIPDLGHGFAEPIAFSEDQVRLVERDGKYLMSESDFESVYYYHKGAKDGYAVMDAIAESHDILSEDIVIMLAEGAVNGAKINKARPKGDTATSGLRAQIKRLSAEIRSLPPERTKQSRKQLRKLRARLVLSEK